MTTDSPTLPGLVPLQQVDGFDSRLIEALRPYWITSAEEFATLRHVANTRHGDGLRAIGATLGLPPEKQDQLLNACFASSRRALSYAAPVELDVGTGLDIDDDYAPPPAPLHYAPYSYPPSWKLKIDHLPPAPQQGSRQTCVAFTLAAMYQIVMRTSDDLSEQFLFWACKALEPKAATPPLRDGRGTLPRYGVEALKTYGVCLEAEWPYKQARLEDDVDNGRPGEAVLRAAAPRRITSGGALPGNAIDHNAICQALSEGLPVLMGVRVYPCWYAGGQGLTAGRVRAPLDGETMRGGHAICAVGYQEDKTAPGGGYIIFRNSYGPDFGAENPDGSGYGHIPYDVVDKENMFAWVIDPPTGAPALAPAPIAASEAPIGAAGGGLLAEARDALARARGELERLEALLGRIERGER